MLADAAIVADGKLFIHGGGWDNMFVAAVPSVHPSLAVVLVIEVQWSETHVERTLEISLYDEDDQPVGVSAFGNFNVGHPPGVTHGSPIVQPLALTFPGITFQKVGQYHFQVKVSDDELERIRFGVRMAPQFPQPPPASQIPRSPF
jgi:hypothetical protein